MGSDSMHACMHGVMANLDDHSGLRYFWLLVPCSAAAAPHVPYTHTARGWTVGRFQTRCDVSRTIMSAQGAAPLKPKHHTSTHSKTTTAEARMSKTVGMVECMRGRSQGLLRLTALPAAKLSTADSLRALFFFFLLVIASAVAELFAVRRLLRLLVALRLRPGALSRCAPARWRLTSGAPEGRPWAGSPDCALKGESLPYDVPLM